MTPSQKYDFILDELHSSICRVRWSERAHTNCRASRQRPAQCPDTQRHTHTLVLTVHTCLVTQDLGRGVRQTHSPALAAPTRGLISQERALWLQASPSAPTHTHSTLVPAPFRPHKAPIVSHNAGRPLSLSPVPSAPAYFCLTPLFAAFQSSVPSLLLTISCLLFSLSISSHHLVISPYETFL